MVALRNLNLWRLGPFLDDIYSFVMALDFDFDFDFIFCWQFAQLTLASISIVESKETFKSCRLSFLDSLLVCSSSIYYILHS